jgi:hypothetical protein
MLLTLSEFQAGVSRYKRLMLFLIAVLLTGVAAWAVAVTIWSDDLDAMGLNWFGAANARVIRPLTLAPVIGGFFLVSGLVQRVANQDPRLRCSTCGAFLGRARTREIVIACKHCANCGSRVIGE